MSCSSIISTNNNSTPSFKDRLRCIGRQIKHQRRLVHLAGRPFDYFFKTIEKAIRHVLARHAAKFLKPPEELLRLQAAGHRNLRIAWDGFAVGLSVARKQAMEEKFG